MSPSRTCASPAPATATVFKDHTGKTEKYPNFAGGIHVVAARYLTIQNNEIVGNGLGVFVNDQNDIAGSSVFTTVCGNYIHENGVKDDLVDSENGSNVTNNDPLYNTGWVYANLIIDDFGKPGGDSTGYPYYHNGPPDRQGRRLSGRVTFPKPASAANLQVKEQYSVRPNADTLEPSYIARKTVTDLGAFPYP